MIGATVIGWGLVINTFNWDESTSFMNWQGYLLGPLGLGGRDGTWAYANLGVLLSLVLSFLVTLVARRGRIRRQEEGTYAQVEAGR